MPPAERRSRPSLRRPAAWLGGGLLALLLLVQLVPYGRDHANPPVTQEARLDPQTRAVVAEACADCHSNRTRWPWYTNVAPLSWFAQSDVEGGRTVLNFSEWDKPQPAVAELEEAITNGEMPPLKYRLFPNHPGSRLSDAERRELIAGLRRMYRDDPPAAIKRIGTQRVAAAP
jgi:mono/diheme cytochrome c family protein